MVALNRAVAAGMARGPEAGIALLTDPELASALAEYQPYHSAIADLSRRAGRLTEAALAYREAIERTGIDAERAFLEQRLRSILT